uniref:Prepilin-type N-terminal cleavage/methylation domain-containing protein n=1 Tax=uncultured Elusimicrobia bacterium TaxID=699876 RepID=A0A650ENJ3_9BACT|nr:hypothetical protein Elusimicrob2101_1540 [uncultured Elusimicrobia bacterium]
MKCFMFLSRHSETLRGAVSGSNCYNKKGFTLLELLVVVLIIGILAAVALPQYQVAVKKSKLVSLMPLLRAISDAEDRFYLANGYYSYIGDLDVSIPQNYIYTYANRDFEYADGTFISQCGKLCGGSNGSTVTGRVNGVTITFYGQYSQPYQNARTCRTGGANKTGIKICKSLGGKSIPSGTSEALFLLP